VAPGSIRGSLLTGMLGLREHPTVGEVAAWLVYTVPVALYVVWPDRRRPSRLLTRARRRPSRRRPGARAPRATGPVRPAA
jgi:high-affinity iron transporter